MQIPARTPAMTAMTAATIDTLSGGRFRLGLGVSGPQVSEGWHGVRFAKPLARTREYVDIVKLALRPQAGQLRRRALHAAAARRPGQGAAAGLPPAARAHPDLPGRGRPEEPGAGRRDRRRLAGRSSSRPATSRRSSSATVGAGRARRPAQDLAGFDVVAHRAGGGRRRRRGLRRPDPPYAALYVGGMGSREQNFYNQLAVRMGYADAAKRGAGPLPGPAAPGGGRGGAAGVHRPHLAARAEGADRREARARTPRPA